MRVLITMSDSGPEPRSHSPHRGARSSNFTANPPQIESARFLLIFDIANLVTQYLRARS